MTRPSKKNENSNAFASKLAQQRSIIDQIDKEMLRLIGRRLAVSKEIGAIKKQHGARVMDGARESKIFERLFRLNAEGMLSKISLFQIFTAIISASRDIQKPRSHGAPESDGPAVYAVLGCPVAHSLSPLMHNTAFSAVDYNGVYIALNVKDIGRAVSGLKALNFRGASITIPHKVAVMEFLDEIDDTAQKILAVNTIKNKDGRLLGYNTDGFGAVRALSEKTTIKGKRVTIIGAGGAARAIGFGIVSEGGRLTLLNRSKEKGEQLALDLGAGFTLLNEINKLDCHILINATPVGMFPNTGQTPLSENLLESDMVVMDIVYNPLRTRLLQKAEAIGCMTVDGVSMFIQQGAKQFELWTGHQPPIEMMRTAVLAALDK